MTLIEKSFKTSGFCLVPNLEFYVFNSLFCIHPLLSYLKIGVEDPGLANQYLFTKLK